MFRLLTCAAVICTATLLAPDAPPPPRALHADVARQTVHLTWKAVQGAEGYRVYRCGPGEADYQPVADVTEAAFDGELGGGVNRFQVASRGQGGVEGARSAVATAARLVSPWGIVVRRDGRRVLRDAACGQAVLQKPDGGFDSLEGPPDGGFAGGYDLGVDGQGRILTVNRGDDKDPRPGFRIYTPAFKLIADRRVWVGGDPGQLRDPMGIAAGPKHEVFIADTGNDRVEEFTDDGRLVHVIGKGELMQPMKIAIGPLGDLYVADSANNRIAVYAPQPDGGYKLARSIGGPKEPCYVAVDAAGRVFVSTNRVAGVYMYTPDGKPAWSWAGSADAPLASPRGLAFDRDGGLLIVDAAACRVVRAEPPDAVAAPVTRRR